MRRTDITRGSASSSSSSPPPPRPPPQRRSMEEVWGEVRPLSQLQEAHRPRRSSTTTGGSQQQQRNPTALTLGSGQSDGYYCGGGGGGGADADVVPVFTNSCFDNYALCGPHGSGAPAGQASYCAKKRALEQQLGEGLGVDHRKKRLIKNRESAARSRARKQAYTNELEQEVAHLLDENSRLRRQYEEVIK